MTLPLMRMIKRCSATNDMEGLSKQHRHEALLLAAREITLGLSTVTIYKFADELLNSGYCHDDLLAIIDARPTSNTNVLSEFQNFCQKHDVLFESHEQATWYLVRYHMARMAQQDSCPGQELGALFREFSDDWYKHLESPVFEKYDMGELIGLTMYYQDEVADEMRRAAEQWLARHGANAE